MFKFLSELLFGKPKPTPVSSQQVKIQQPSVSAAEAPASKQREHDDDRRFARPVQYTPPGNRGESASTTATAERAKPKLSRDEILFQTETPKTTTTILIGFDFGTHSTKVVCRERKPNSLEADIVVFDKEAPGYPATASPSLVRIDNNRLYFGTDALQRETGELYRSLKVELLPGFQRPASDFPAGVSSKLLITAYLTWAFQQVLENLGDYQAANKRLNISAPMDHFDSGHMRETYLQIVQTAWALAFDDQYREPFQQGMRLEKARSLIEPLIERPVENLRTRPFDVMPETIAPIVSISLDPLSKPGLYAIVDMGAATTEVSIFHLSERGFDQKVLCYQDTTQLMGGNDLHIDGISQEFLAKRCIQAVERQFKMTWFNGFGLDKRNPHARERWKELTILLSGGGTLNPKIRSFIDSFNPKAAFERQGDLIGPVIRERHVPSEISQVRDIDDQSLSLYAVANGLAVDAGLWPEIHEDIEPMAGVTLEEKPVAYWYTED